MAFAKYSRGRAGFSLVEALIVIAIIGVLATMSITTLMSARPHANLEREEVALASALADARNMAVSEEVAARVVFNEGASTYQLEKLVDGTWVASGSEKVLSDGVTLGSGAVQFSGDTVEFTVRGTLMSGGYIRLTAANGDTAILVGNIASGRFAMDGGNAR